MFNQTEEIQMKHGETCVSGFYRLRDVLKVYPVSKSTWWEGVRTGRFPQPVKLSERTTAWRVEDIQNLISEVGCAQSRG